jgi:hypothetical protein
LLYRNGVHRFTEFVENSNLESGITEEHNISAFGGLEIPA